MTEPKRIFNPLKLNHRPHPRRSAEIVFSKECIDSDPRQVSPNMLVRTASEMNLLGRMYDKQFVECLDTGGTPSFFGTQQSYLNMLKTRGLVDFIPRQRNRYHLTVLGVRVYELNYWLDQWKKNERAIKRGRKTESMDGADGWVNPKPLSEPKAQAPRQQTTLPPGVYPRLDKS